MAHISDLAAELLLYLKLDGTTTMTGNLQMGSKDIRGLDDIGTVLFPMGKIWCTNFDVALVATVHSNLFVSGYIRTLTYLQTDEIREYLLNAGVTIDGVKLKDGILEDSAYPSALLLDGSRASTGDFPLGAYKLKGSNIYLIEKHFGGGRYAWRSRYIDESADAWFLALGFVFPYGAQYAENTFSSAQSKFLWQIPRGTNKFFVNLKGSQIPDDHFLELGDAVSGFPAASATYRGMLSYTKGAGGARDRVYACLKSDADAYSWVEIANGGA